MPEQVSAAGLQQAASRLADELHRARARARALSQRAAGMSTRAARNPRNRPGDGSEAVHIARHCGQRDCIDGHVAKRRPLTGDRADVIAATRSLRHDIGLINGRYARSHGIDDLSVPPASPPRDRWHPRDSSVYAGARRPPESACASAWSRQEPGQSSAGLAHRAIPPRAEVHSAAYRRFPGQERSASRPARPEAPTATARPRPRHALLRGRPAPEGTIFRIPPREAWIRHVSAVRTAGFRWFARLAGWQSRGRKAGFASGVAPASLRDRCPRAGAGEAAQRSAHIPIDEAGRRLAAKFARWICPAVD